MCTYRKVELSYRPESGKKPRITESSECAAMLRENWDKGQLLYREAVKVVLLNNNSRVLGVFESAEGGLTCCQIDVRIILQAALLSNATCIILAHNHPSGRTTPSMPDVSLTKDVAEACKAINIRLLDHIIITESDYYSFHDNGKL